MKNLLYTFIAALLFVVTNYAQTKIDAKDIIKQIDEGKSVKYENVTIVGDMDFTLIKNSDTDRPNRKKRSWLDKVVSFGHNSSNEVLYHVEVPVSFINCTFEGSVIAYYHDDYEDLTHNVIFYKDATFNGCKFKEASEFKYVRFEKGSGFAKCTFNEEALFKYTEFENEVSFEGSKFYRDANFKYTQFHEKADFSDSYFDREANFKYTDFPYGVSFENSVFDGLANFKYASLDQPSNFDNAEFNGDVDFKYAEYDGNSFVRHLLKSRKD